MSFAQWRTSGLNEDIPDLLSRIFGKFKDFVEPASGPHVDYLPIRETGTVKTGFEQIHGSARRLKAATNWYPTSEVIEMESEYLIIAEISGVKHADVKISFDDGFLTMMGLCKTGMLTVEDERYTHNDEHEEIYRRIERTYGSFARCYQLPDDADGNCVMALFEDGILSAKVAKKANHVKKVANNLALRCKGMDASVCDMSSGHSCAVKVLRNMMSINNRYYKQV